MSYSCRARNRFSGRGVLFRSANIFNSTNCSSGQVGSFSGGRYSGVTGMIADRISSDSGSMVKGLAVAAANMIALRQPPVRDRRDPSAAEIVWIVGKQVGPSNGEEVFFGVCARPSAEMKKGLEKVHVDGIA